MAPPHVGKEANKVNALDALAAGNICEQLDTQCEQDQQRHTTRRRTCGPVKVISFRKHITQRLPKKPHVNNSQAFMENEGDGINASFTNYREVNGRVLRGRQTKAMDEAPSKRQRVEMMTCKVTSPAAATKRNEAKDEAPSQRQNVEKKTGSTATVTSPAVAAKKQLHKVCPVCNEPYSSDAYVVTCEGGCQASFHAACLGDMQRGNEKDWVCKECTLNTRACFICGVDGRELLPCSRRSCGKYYHLSCLETNELAQVTERNGVKVIACCPQHICGACQKLTPALVGGTLQKCILCPASYHEECTPGGSRQRAAGFVCSAHVGYDLVTTETPAVAAVGSQVKAAARCKERKKVTNARRRTWGLLPPLILSSQPNEFRIPASFLSDVNSTPPHFKTIKSLIYMVPRPARLPPTGEACSCDKKAGACASGSCLNQSLMVECISANSDQSAKKGGVLDKYTNCKSGNDCGNRQLSKRLFKQMKVVKQDGMGWGIQVQEDAACGELICEYLGEVIDEEEMERRLKAQKERNPNDNEHYIMELESGLFIDAKMKGSLSRFINHSCAPNCTVAKWNVAGMARLGIFANRAIPKGSWLSYDYKFATNEKRTFSCRCGAKACRGSLAPKSAEEKAAELEQGPEGCTTQLKGAARKALLKKSRLMQRQNWRRADKALEAKMKRLNQTARTVPGDSTHEISAGPLKKLYPIVRHARLFLPRNARCGEDILQRKIMLQRRHAWATKPLAKEK